MHPGNDVLRRPRACRRCHCAHFKADSRDVLQCPHLQICWREGWGAGSKPLRQMMYPKHVKYYRLFLHKPQERSYLKGFPLPGGTKPAKQRRKSGLYWNPISKKESNANPVNPMASSLTLNLQATSHPIQQKSKIFLLHSWKPWYPLPLTVCHNAVVFHAGDLFRPNPVAGSGFCIFFPLVLMLAWRGRSEARSHFVMLWTNTWR